jgi:hypothetical protein
MPQARSWQEMRSQIVEILERRTGAGLDTWNQRIADRAPASEAELRAWLDDQGVDGYPRMLLVYERFGYPDFLLAGADDLIDGQYADRPGLRPILDALLAIAPSLGTVEVQARKTYVTLLTPRRTFASIEPRTRTRVDLGLRLPSPVREGRLEPSTSLGQSGMTARIALGSAEDVDDEVIAWLQRTYAVNI